MKEDRKPESEMEKIVMPGDICVCCGKPVPEGRQICWACEHGEIKTDDGIKGKRYEGVKRF